jgi:hypothetical protein
MRGRETYIQTDRQTDIQAKETEGDRKRKRERETLLTVVSGVGATNDWGGMV